MFKAIARAREIYHASLFPGTKGPQKEAIGSSLVYADPNLAATLDIQPHPPEVFKRLDVGSQKILHMFAQRAWALAPAHTQGITWWELCCLLFLQGGTHEDLQLNGKLLA